MSKLLFVNACMRGRGVSRTHALCEQFLAALQTAAPETEISELDLTALPLAPLSGADIERRESPDISENDPAFTLAHRFASADIILLGAPYWDLSLPSVVKVFAEHICVNHVTFRYGEGGIPVGLCRAKVFLLVTTAGGFLGERNFGYNYWDSLCKAMFGIENTRLLACEGLDIKGLDPAATLSESYKKIPALAEEIAALLQK